MKSKYRKVAGLRSRPVQEADCLMVFSPLAPKIQWLDLGAWLIFELCDGHSVHEIERAYIEVMGRDTDDLHEQMCHQVQAGLEALVRSKLIEPYAVSPDGGTL